MLTATNFRRLTQPSSSGKLCFNTTMYGTGGTNLLLTCSEYKPTNFLYWPSYIKARGINFYFRKTVALPFLLSLVEY